MVGLAVVSRVGLGCLGPLRCGLIRAILGVLKPTHLLLEAHLRVGLDQGCLVLLVHYFRLAASTPFDTAILTQKPLPRLGGAARVDRVGDLERAHHIVGAVLAGPDPLGQLLGLSDLPLELLGILLVFRVVLIHYQIYHFLTYYRYALFVGSVLKVLVALFGA